MTDTDSGEPDRHRTNNIVHFNNVERLTNDTLHNILGQKYASTIIYNFDTASWNNTQYNGKRLIYQKADTISTRLMKKVIEQDPTFKDIEIIAYAISTTDKTNANCTVICSSTISQDTLLIGTIICRNKRSRKIIPFPNKWLTYKKFDSHENIANNGAYEFANFVTINSAFRKKLLSIYTK